MNINQILEESVSAVASESSDSDSSDGSVAGENDEMEEGEIRKVDSVPQVIQSEKKLVQEAASDEELNNDSLHGNMEGVHGEQNGLESGSFFPWSAEAVNGGGTSELNRRNPFNMGSNVSMGQKIKANSRKSRRCMRSPVTQEKEAS
ncbi:hypothetical protein Hanom_Chr02g00106081 [Helianthus anomalus]